jgi:hypothetical protein
MLSSWMLGRPKVQPESNDQDEAEPGMVARRGRLAIYRDPATISRPPEYYVLDLLEGSMRPLRCPEPLAQRVVILPELL